MILMQTARRVCRPQPGTGQEALEQSLAKLHSKHPASKNMICSQGYLVAQTREANQHCEYLWLLGCCTFSSHVGARVEDALRPTWLE